MGDIGLLEPKKLKVFSFRLLALLLSNLFTAKKTFLYFRN